MHAFACTAVSQCAPAPRTMKITSTASPPQLRPPWRKKSRAAAHLSGERRIVTVLHVDVVNSTALAEEVGDETWTTIMTGAYDRFARQLTTMKAPLHVYSATP